MKKLKFAIIGGRPGVHAKDLIEEIIRRGHIAIPVRMKNIIITFSENEPVFIYKNINLLDCDIFLFRGGYRMVRPAVSVLAQYLLNQKKIIVNDDLGKEGFFGDKIFQASQFHQHHIPHPQTAQALSARDLSFVIEKIGLPIIAKPIFGSKGNGIKKFENFQEAKEFLRKNNRGYFLQEYLPIDGDIRVFVVGNQVVAGMKRHILQGDFRSNASLGAKASRIALTPQIKKLALDAAQVMNYEIAGVDIIKKQDGKYCVLEVNSAPQWKKLKEVTGIDPSSFIIDYALSKYSSARKK